MKQEIKVSEINRVERLLESIDNSVECNGRDYVKQYLVTQIALNQFGNTRQLEDLKTQLNWVRSNEG